MWEELKMLWWLITTPEGREVGKMLAEEQERFTKELRKMFPFEDKCE